MSRVRLLVVFVVPVILLAGALLQLASAQTPEPTPPPADACHVGLTKIVAPTDVLLGETARVTLVMTNSCPSVAPPMDLMFLVDVSNSMTKGDNARVADPCDPGAGSDPLPTKQLTPGTGEPTEPGRTQPTQCPTRPAVLPIIAPTRGSIIEPTGSATKGTPDPRTPPPTQGSIIGPTRPPIVDTRPAEDPGTEDLILEVQKFIRDFTTDPVTQQAADDGRLRMALVAFESRPHTISGLTNKLTRITSGASRLDSLPHGTTNVALGFYRANQIMDRGLDASRGANRVIVLFSDGKFDTKTIRGLRTREGIIYLGVAMGKSPDLSQLSGVVTERRYLLNQTDLPVFMDLYKGELQMPRAVSAVRALIHDELESNMRYVTGSAVPTATVTGQVIEWLFEPPTSPVTMTYEVEPLDPGRWPVSREAHSDWTDTIGRNGTKPFPAVDVNVRAPTQTPTYTPVPTDTPTVTPTTELTATPTLKPPVPLYLPVAFRQPAPKPCIPSEQTVDVAIVIDTSDSMLTTTSTGRTKLDAAVEAGRVLASLLKLDGGGDQVTVIGFNHDAYVLTELSGSSVAVGQALDRLPSTQDRGTRIDTAVQAAYQQLTGPKRRPGNSAAMVLLTDGRHEGDAADVITAANTLKAAGVVVHTVGLGTDADGALLAAVASDPAYYYYAPDAEGLGDIYRRIAAVIPCP